ncbi:hypothetical protein ACS0TY_031414 [Phlomoides rotata]
MISKMNRLSVTCLLLLTVCNLAYSRLITEDLDKSNPSLAAPESCEPTYGVLPCSSNAWGLLFLIVVYEILLSLGGKYVGMGSELFFAITGPGIVGGSLFQFLGTIPQIVLVLVSALSGSVEAAQQRATLGMGLVAGTTVMLLTLIWGASIVLGSYDLSEGTIIDTSGTQKERTLKGVGVVTDVETSYTARIMAITLIPFLIILLAKAFTSSSGKRVVMLIALIITVVLLFAFILYQIFRPWIQYRRFDHLMNKYAKDKLQILLSRNGKPDVRKIQALFNRIDKDNNTSISAAELRVLLLGMKMDDDDLAKARDVESVLVSFDTSGDGRINQDEFVQGMIKLVTDLSDEKNRAKKSGGSTSQNSSDLQQGLLDKSTNTKARNLWWDLSTAFFFVILGTAMLCALAEPLINSVVAFAQAANLPSFSVSYLAIPFAMNYRVAVQSIASARQKTKQSISLTLSALYGGVYMNNVISLLVFLAPVYALNLSVDVFAEIIVVLIILIFMTLLTSLCTKFPRWLGYLVLTLYPASLAFIYLLTSVIGWP